MILQNAYYTEVNKTITGSHKTGGFYSCINEVRFSLYNLFKKQIYPEHVSFKDTLNALHNYSDNNDLYPFLYKSNLDLLPQLKNENFEYNGWWSNVANFSTLNFKQLKLVEDIYFTPSDIVNERVNLLKNKYNIDYSNTTAILHRGTDKYTEVQLASYTTWIEHITKFNTSNNRLLIQTDELNCKNALLDIFKNAFCFDEMLFNNTYVRPIENKIEWCINFESIMRIISQCNFIVTHAGNCGIIPILYRANLTNVSQCSHDGQFIIF